MMATVTMRLFNGAVLCIAMLFWAVIALATATKSSEMVSPDWVEHAGSLAAFVGCLIASLLSIIGVLLIRALNSASSTLKDFREDMKDLCGRVETTEKEVAYLKGAQEALTGMKISCIAEVEK